MIKTKSYGKKRTIEKIKRGKESKTIINEIDNNNLDLTRE